MAQLELPTPVTALVVRELSGAEADDYYAALDSNRNHFRRFGDYADEIAAPYDVGRLPLAPASPADRLL